MYKRGDNNDNRPNAKRVAPQVECIIKKKLKTIRVNNSGWVREANIITWAGGPSKLDIRDWSKDHTRASKGLTFTRQEVIALKDVFSRINPNDIDEFIPNDTSNDSDSNNDSINGQNVNPFVSDENNSVKSESINDFPDNEEKDASPNLKEASA